MQKSLLIGVVIVGTILAVGAFWMFQSRPVGEAVPLVSATASPLGTTGELSSPMPTLSPATGAGASPQASPTTSATAMTVSVTANGFSPAVVTVPVNGTVTFVNNDTQQHQPSSAPHPLHTEYPPLNSSVLTSGQSFTVTFTRAGTFNVHDHLNPGLRATITVR